MKKILIGLTALSCFFTFASDFEISKKKSVIKVKAGEDQVFDIKIVEPLDKFVVIFQYEYWGEICEEYTRINDPQDEYGREKECSRYKRGLIQTSKRLKVIDNTGASNFVIKAEQRGYDMNLYLIDAHSNKKKLKKNILGSYKLKI